MYGFYLRVIDDLTWDSLYRKWNLGLFGRMSLCNM